LRSSYRAIAIELSGYRDRVIGLLRPGYRAVAIELSGYLAIGLSAIARAIVMGTARMTTAFCVPMNAFAEP
jgi:hypothetical protein